MMPTSRTGDRERGFSLLELIVALTIASLVLTAAYTAFWLVVSSARRLEAHADAHQSVRTLSSALEADLRSALPPRGAGGEEAFEERRLRFRAVDRAGAAGVVEYALADGAIRRTFTPAGRLSREPDAAHVAESVADWRLAYDARGGAAMPGGGWPSAVRFEVRFGEAAEGATPPFRRTIRVEAETVVAAGERR